MSTTLTHTVKPGRRDTPRRIMPGLIEFYEKRAHQLRVEYYRDTWRAIWRLLFPSPAIGPINDPVQTKTFEAKISHAATGFQR
jgi:hypothetical protein